jgi:hypothetical protein
MRQQILPKIWYLVYTKIYGVTTQNTVTLESDHSVLKLNNMKMYRKLYRNNSFHQNFCKLWRFQFKMSSLQLINHQSYIGYLIHQYLVRYMR